MASQSKPPPSSSKSSSRRTFDSLLGSSNNHRASSFDDPFRSEPPPRHHAPFDFDSMFSSPASDGKFSSRSVNSPPPAYDDGDGFDIFDGVPGLKRPTKVKFDDDVFAVFDSVPGLKSSLDKVKLDDVVAPVKPDSGALDEPLDEFGEELKGRKRSEKDERVASDSDFDDWYIV